MSREARELLLRATIESVGAYSDDDLEELSRMINRLDELEVENQTLKAENLALRAEIRQTNSQ